MNERTAPPAGLEPAASGLRARRHRLFDHGGKKKLRRQGSNLRLTSNSRASYRLDHTGMKRRQQDSNLRTVARLRVSTAPPSASRPCLHWRKGRESNPQGPEANPFSRRGTAPVAALPCMASAGVEPAT